MQNLSIYRYIHTCACNLWFCRAQSFAERLRLGIAVIHGEAQDAESDLVDGRHSPPTVKNIGAIHPSLEIPCKHLCAALHVISNLHTFLT